MYREAIFSMATLVLILSRHNKINHKIKDFNNLKNYPATMKMKDELDDSHNTYNSRSRMLCARNVRELYESNIILEKCG